MPDYITMFILVLTLASLSTVVRTSTSGDLIYACYPNSTLKIQNPGNFQGVFANNSVNICNTTFTNAKLFLYVTNCPLNVSISVTFSNYSDISAGILGGKVYVDSYLITCEQISANGEFAIVSAGLDVSMRQSNQTTVYTDFNITSGIYMWDFGQQKAYEIFDASIGDMLDWIIQIDEGGFILRPEECTAYAGTNLSAVTNGTSRKVITLLGCTTDTELTTDFEWLATGNLLYAKLYAFRFFESEYITIECSVRICHNTSSHCDIDCSGTGKRKRNAPFYDIENVVDEGDMDTMKHTSMQFRVPLSGSTKVYVCGWLVAVLCALVVAVP